MKFLSIELKSRCVKQFGGRRRRKKVSEGEMQERKRMRASWGWDWRRGMIESAELV